MKYLLLHPPTFSTEAIGAALESEGVETRTVRRQADLAVDDVPTTLVLDPDSRRSFSVDDLRHFVQAGGAIVAVGAPGERDVPTNVPEGVLAAFVPQPYGQRQLLIALRTAYREAAALSESARARQEAAYRTKEIKELTRIGMALTTERDYDALLDLILEQARQITGSDAGSLYLAEADEGKQRGLRFKLSQNFSRPDIPLVEFTIPLDTTSIAGYVASTCEPLVIDDAYFLPPDVEYKFYRTVDEKYGYRTKSVLTIPMQDHKDQVIGVLQLINRKRHHDAKLETPGDVDAEVIPYTRRLVDLVSALAGHAAVSLENSQLYERIERLFENFMTAAVRAVEMRDPATFGHSGRVAKMTVGLAETANRAGDGPFRKLSYTREQLQEIRYASLLHDFGKVSVREEVLRKAKKLYSGDLNLIRQRYDFLRRSAETEFFRKRVEFMEEHGRQGYQEFLQQQRATYDAELGDLKRFMEVVLESNEPTVLPEGSFEELHRYAMRFYCDFEGKEQPLLTGDEVRFLSIRKGNLDENERREIEDHVDRTYQFLLKLPWTPALQAIPDIARGHHEKLDGSGYPQKLLGEQIPVPTRMMTIADIFDALTASDRPYKRRIPVPRALDILDDEVKRGQLDAALYQLFTEARVFERAEED